MPSLVNLLIQGIKSMEQCEDPKCTTSGLDVQETLRVHSASFLIHDRESLKGIK